MAETKDKVVTLEDLKVLSDYNKSAEEYLLEPYTYHTTSWASGTLGPTDGANVSDSTKIRSTNSYGALNSYNRIRCPDTYYMMLYALNSSGTYAGVYKTDGTIAKTSGSVAHVTDFDTTRFPDYTFRIVLSQNPSSSSIATSDGNHVALMRYASTAMTQSGKPADGKAVGDILFPLERDFYEKTDSKITIVKPKNWLNLDAITLGEVTSDGTVVESSTRFYTDYIPVGYGDSIVVCRGDSSSSGAAAGRLYHRHVCFYDADKNVIAGGNDTNAYTAVPVPHGACFARVTCDLNITTSTYTPVISLTGQKTGAYYPYFEPYFVCSNDYLTDESQLAVDSVRKTVVEDPHVYTFVKGGIITKDGTTTTNAARIRTSSYIDCQFGMRVTVADGAKMLVCAYQNNGDGTYTYIRGLYQLDSSGETTGWFRGTFTVPGGSSYIFVAAYEDDSAITDTDAARAAFADTYLDFFVMHPTDMTLTMPDRAADAKATGDAISSCSELLTYRFGTPTQIVAPTSVSFSYDSESELYRGTLSGINMSSEYENYSENHVYAVTFDGTETILVMSAPTIWTAEDVYSSMTYMGNTGLLGIRDPYSETVPYVITYYNDTKAYVFTSDTAATHTISVSRIPVIYGPVRKTLKTLVSRGTGAHSIVIGDDVSDADISGFAGGWGALAGQMSVALGVSARAKGVAAYALGHTSLANGMASVAIGYGAHARGDYAYALGDHAVANGKHALSAGLGTSAASDNQVALGSFNVTDDNDQYALILGDGTASNERSNLFTIARDGTVESKGKPLALRDEPAVAVSGATPSITASGGMRYVCGECSTLSITVPESGIVDVIFESGSTPTVLTVTPPEGMTMKWAGGFDPTSLNANTVYEVNIMDGCYGVVGSWT